MHTTRVGSSFFFLTEHPSPRSSVVFTRSSSPSSTGSLSDLAFGHDQRDAKSVNLFSKLQSASSYRLVSRNAQPPQKVVLGVCAMDVKARSKAMREILTRLVERAQDAIEVKVFGDKVILDEGLLQYGLLVL